MVYRQGKRGPFWSCTSRYADGSWCRNTKDAGIPTAERKGGESVNAGDGVDERLKDAYWGDNSYL